MKFSEISINIHHALHGGCAKAQPRPGVPGSPTREVRCHPDLGVRYVRMVKPSGTTVDWIQQDTQPHRRGKTEELLAKLARFNHKITRVAINNRTTPAGVVNGEWSENLAVDCTTLVRDALHYSS